MARMQKSARSGKGVPPLAGHVELLELVEVLANPDRTRAVLAELQALRDEIAGTVENKARLSQADRILEQAHETRAKADERLRSAESESESLVAAAQSGIAQDRAALAEERNRYQSIESALNAKLAEVEKKEEAAVGAMANAQKELNEASRIREEAERIRSEFKQKAAKLSAAMQ